jgi:hypothetical protein
MYPPTSFCRSAYMNDTARRTCSTRVQNASEQRLAADMHCFHRTPWRLRLTCPRLSSAWRGSPSLHSQWRERASPRPCRPRRHRRGPCCRGLRLSRSAPTVRRRHCPSTLPWPLPGVAAPHTRPAHASPPPRLVAWGPGWRGVNLFQRGCCPRREASAKPQRRVGTCATPGLLCIAVVLCVDAFIVTWRLHRAASDAGPVFARVGQHARSVLLVMKLCVVLMAPIPSSNLDHWQVRPSGSPPELLGRWHKLNDGTVEFTAGQHR